MTSYFLLTFKNESGIFAIKLCNVCHAYESVESLTFHLHDLIGVLDDFVLGLVAEGVGPGLDQIKDLGLHVRFGLFLNTKVSHSVSDDLKTNI